MATRPKRPQVGTLWRGPLGWHEIFSVTGRSVTVVDGDRKSKQARPPSLKAPPPSTETYDLATYMTNQKPNERDAGNSGKRRRAAHLACKKDKSKRVIAATRPR